MEKIKVGNNKNINFLKGLKMNEARNFAIKVSFIYCILGILWVFGTDYISMMLAEESLELYALFQQSKGWLYIVITAVLLFGTIQYWARSLLLSQNKLYEREQKYSSLFNHNPDAIFKLDMEGNMISVNPRGKKIFGDKLEEEKSGLLALMFDPETVSEYFEMAVNGKSSILETLVYNQHGEQKILKCSFVPIIVNEKIAGVYIIARDITKIRRDEELIIASEKLSVVGHLAAAVAHEVRNPLTSLKGFVQLMDLTKEVKHEHIDIMLKEIDRIHIISSELLILGKKQDVAFLPLNLHECLEQVLVLMNVQAQMDNIQIHYNKKTADYLNVMADSIQIKQVLINIIKNSMEAMQNQGDIWITLNRNDEEAIITVRDNGIGIESERLKHLGEPFYSTKEKGTGLGLAICQKIIQRHHGKILFESEKNKGTTVTITIPLA
jgi:two-component system, sporulation sensor kinase E